MKIKLFVAVATVMLLAAGCANNTNDINTTEDTSQSKKAPMTITSSVFESNETIPTKYTCDGDNINPPLAFNSIPTNAKNLVLVMDDPDVPTSIKPDGVFDHWVVYNMPTDTREIPENDSTVPGNQGKNGTGEAKYTGPCPPDREHRYFFKLYAVDTELTFVAAPTKTEVLQAIQGHIIEEAELIGRYNRPQNQGN